MKIFPLLLIALTPFAAFAEEKPLLPTAHTPRNIEGWNVRVDDRLLSGDGAGVGERALKLLTARLVAIAIVVPEPALAKLRAITIQLDSDYGDLRVMQYHPSAGWLKGNGYSETLAKCAHIPDAEQFLSPFENHRMPWVVLHELAHGFHDQTIGFEDARVIAVWKKFRDSGKYQSVLTSPGQMREHYGLTNQKEFFAEMTEAYFGSNDFYPFVTGELKQAEPETFALLAEIWGPLPGRTSAKPSPKTMKHFLALFVVCHARSPGLCRHTAKPLKVFILAGQSNMEGHAKVETFDYIGDDPATAPLLEADARRGRQAARVRSRVDFLSHRRRQRKTARASAS